MNFWFDLKYAFRLLLKKPGFTGLTVAVMAAGLGLCVFMFSFIYATMLKPLPFENGERMVIIDKEVDGVLHNGGQVKYSYYQDVKEQANSFEMIGAMQEGVFTISGGDNAANYRGVLSEPMLFNFTKVNPIKGRIFNKDDDTPGASPVAVIGFDLWQNYFAAREDIIGHEFFVEGVKTEVIGVMPSQYLFPRASQLWLPIKFEPHKYTRGSGPHIQVYAMLNEGVDSEQANNEMAQIIHRTNSQYPEHNTGELLAANTFMISIMGNGVKPIIAIMFIAVGFVLLLACINVANLLYARSTERAKETAIRVALGAPQSRLVMQMLWESLIICSLGGVFAILMAAYGTEVTKSILPSFLSGRPPFWYDIKIDASLVWLTLALTLLTAFITGILPAIKIIHGDFNAVLRDGTRGAISKKAKRVSQLLVIFEVTLSVALLTAAIVMAVAINQAMDTDYGARTEKMLTAHINLPGKHYETAEQRLTYLRNLEAELKAQPGVNGVAFTSALPAQNGAYRSVMPEGFETTKDARPPRAVTVNIMPGAMEALEYKLIKGRFISNSDDADSEKVIVVTQSFADRMWPGETEVLGKRVKWADVEDSPWYRVVGVVGTIIHGQPFADFKHRPSVYRSNLQSPSLYLKVAVTTDGDPNQLRGAMIKAFDSVDGNVPAFRIKTIKQILQRNTAGMGFVIKLFMLFGICATVLAGSGIYALMSNAIGQRTQEFGVRRALGATDGQVVGLLLKQGLIQLAIGTLIGLPLAFMFGNLIMTMIGVSSWDIYAVFIYIPLFIAAVVLLATYIPALRVTRVEPNVALRYE